MLYMLDILKVTYLLKIFYYDILSDIQLKESNREVEEEVVLLTY